MRTAPSYCLPLLASTEQRHTQSSRVYNPSNQKQAKSKPSQLTQDFTMTSPMSHFAAISLAAFLTFTICLTFDGHYCVHSEELLKDCYQICDTINTPMKVLVIILSLLGGLCYLAVPHRLKQSARRGIFLIITPFIAIYGVTGFEHMMLNIRTEHDGSYLLLIYFILSIFTAIWQFTWVILTIYFKKDAQHQHEANLQIDADSTT